MEDKNGILRSWDFLKTRVVVCQAYRLVFDLFVGVVGDSERFPHVEVG